ncbi:MAG: HAMP domain-containing sensor histidine kinase [Alphaproteobacteria bacterium]|nr:HAMP domain-containing sensor histidine kinase [Alphaproteobacteria bacterium]
MRLGLPTRLVLVLTGAMFATWILAAGSAFYVISHELDEVFDSALQETAQQLLPLALEGVMDAGDADDTRMVRGDSLAPHEEYLIYQLRNSSGAILLQSHDAVETPFPATAQQGFNQSGGYRFYTETAGQPPYFLQVAEKTNHRRQAAIEATLGLLPPLLIVMPLSAILIWWIVQQMLQPIGRLQRLIGSRDGANLSPLGLVDLPPDLAPIASSVDRLLDRVRRTLEAEKHFTANSAHELRTPIAGALAQTQRLISELSNGPNKDRARQIETALSRLGSISEKLLQLARAEAPAPNTADDIDAAIILQAVIDDLAGTTLGHNRLALQIADQTYQSWPVDADTLGIVLRNLIENALRHGDASQPVTVTLDEAGAIRIVNQGTIVPPDRFNDLSRPFARGNSQSSGTGLGLAIVRALVDRSALRLAFFSPASGQDSGVEAVLTVDPTKRKEAAHPIR